MAAPSMWDFSLRRRRKNRGFLGFNSSSLSQEEAEVGIFPLRIPKYFHFAFQFQGCADSAFVRPFTPTHYLHPESLLKAVF
jgi:hypothetical protein